MTIETVAVTGGSGLIGGETVSLLEERGYHPVALDQRPPDAEAPGDFVEVDLLDAGETYGALAQSDADAVIHLGTITDPGSDPGYVTFRSNAMSSYVVLEAAAGLGIEAASVASSINAIGWSFHADCPAIEYLPVDEAHPATPRDPYALGKRVAEVVAAGFGRNRGAPDRIATLRYPGVYDDEQLAALADREWTLADLEAAYDPGDNPGFYYLHVRDAASAAVRGIDRLRRPRDVLDGRAGLLGRRADRAAPRGVLPRHRDPRGAVGGPGCSTSRRPGTCWAGRPNVPGVSGGSVPSTGG